MKVQANLRRLNDTVTWIALALALYCAVRLHQVNGTLRQVDQAFGMADKILTDSAAVAQKQVELDTAMTNELVSLRARVNAR